MGKNGDGQRRISARMASTWVLGALTLVACAPAPQAESPPEPEQEEPEPAPPPPDPEPLAAPGEPESDPEVAPVPAGPAPTELVSTICQDTCKRVAASCSERAASFCNASCGDYVSGAEKCPVEVHDALSCQQNAEDFLLCSNIAAESCAESYRTMKRCRDGEIAAQTWGAKKVAAPAEDVPPGFLRKQVEAHGFSVIMPKDANFSMGTDGAFEMSGTDERGIRYVTKSVDLNGKASPTATSILQTATAYVGNACQPKLRLHGRFETQGVIHVRMDTVCSDGTAYHGILHFWDKKAVVCATVIPSEPAGGTTNPALEPFLFGFQRPSP